MVLPAGHGRTPGPAHKKTLVLQGRESLAVPPQLTAPAASASTRGGLTPTIPAETTGGFPRSTRRLEGEFGTLSAPGLHQSPARWAARRPYCSLSMPLSIQLCGRIPTRAGACQETRRPIVVARPEASGSPAMARLMLR